VRITTKLTMAAFSKSVNWSQCFKTFRLRSLSRMQNFPWLTNGPGLIFRGKARATTVSARCDHFES